MWPYLSIMWTWVYLHLYLLSTLRMRVNLLHRQDQNFCQITIMGCLVNNNTKCYIAQQIIENMIIIIATETTSKLPNFKVSFHCIDSIQKEDWNCLHPLFVCLTILYMWTEHKQLFIWQMKFISHNHENCTKEENNDITSERQN